MRIDPKPSGRRCPAPRRRAVWTSARATGVPEQNGAKSHVLVTGLADDGPDGDLVRSRLRGEELDAPHLIDLEVTSAWRRLAAAHEPLLGRCWELRDYLTVHDAAHVALAELMQVDLLTADQRLGDAPGIRCDVEVL
jgi:predicted nucleic acid-binding protein